VSGVEASLAMSTSRRKQQARKRGARQRAERQARRERAAELFAQGRTQAEVARELDVSRQSASRWHAAGTTGLQSRGPTGRRPKIPDSAVEGIEQALLEGAQAHGFVTDVWTLDRIAVLIQGLTGCSDRIRQSGDCCAIGWAGRCSGPRARPRNVTRRPSSTGSSLSGRGSKKGPREIRLACLLRRIGHLADPTGTPHLVPARPHADPAPPHGLEARQHGRCPRLPPRRHQGQVVPPPAARQLRHRQPHRRA
jgi:transposase